MYPTSSYAGGGGGFLYFLLGAPPLPLPPLKKEGMGDGGEGYHLMDR